MVITIDENNERTIGRKIPFSTWIDIASCALVKIITNYSAIRAVAKNWHNGRITGERNYRLCVKWMLVVKSAA
jgi:hypothetical protein